MHANLVALGVCISIVCLITAHYYTIALKRALDRTISAHACSYGTLLTEVHPPFSIRVGGSSVHGNGVFATKHFSAGEIIEKAPLLQVPDTSMLNYVFRSKVLGCNYIALGYGSIYNHSDDCNAKVSTTYYKDGSGYDRQRATFRVIAVKPIDVGSEITINYGPHYNWKRRCSH